MDSGSMFEIAGKKMKRTKIKIDLSMRANKALKF